MKTDNETLNELLECAIREKAAIKHMEELDRRSRLRIRRIRFISYAAAACVALFAFTGIKLGHDARNAGYAFNPVAGQMGGSEITALMQEKQIRQALDAIGESRAKLAQEMADPSSPDPEYLDQLESDRQELDLLEAVCWLRQGHYFKGKKALKEIAFHDGVFATEAQSILESL